MQSFTECWSRAEAIVTDSSHRFVNCRQHSSTVVVARLSGHIGKAIPWARFEAQKVAILWQFVMRFLKRDSFSRSVAIARLKDIYDELNAPSVVKGVLACLPEWPEDEAEDLEPEPEDTMLAAWKDDDTVVLVRSSMTISEASEHLCFVICFVSLSTDCRPGFVSAEFHRLPLPTANSAPRSAAKKSQTMSSKPSAWTNQRVT